MVFCLSVVDLWLLQGYEDSQALVADDQDTIDDGSHVMSPSPSDQSIIDKLATWIIPTNHTYILPKSLLGSGILIRRPQKRASRQGKADGSPGSTLGGEHTCSLA